ncbi:hypothetical protein ES703_125593 [subsurface metagenome]
MPRLTKTERNRRIRELEVGKNLWLRANVPNYENGGMLDIYRVSKDTYRVTLWDAENERSHWIPRNARKVVYEGFVAGAIAIVHELRKGVME